jgi:hypothetical protein
MSINLGTAACEAMARLRTHADWKIIRDAIHEHARKSANTAIEVEHTFQAAACGYARAMRDLFVAIEAATDQVRPQQV